MKSPLERVYQFIVRHYDLEELRTLCFGLSVNYDALRGDGTAAKTRELLLYLGRRRRLDALLDKLQETRPEVIEWAGLRIDAAELNGLYAGLPEWEDGTKLALQQVKIFMRGDFTSMTPDRRSAVIDALAGLLRIPPQVIEVFHVYEGSVVFELGLPLEAVRRLRSLLKSNNAQLRLLKIEKVRLEIEPGEIETWVYQAGKFNSTIGSEKKKEKPDRHISGVITGMATGQTAVGSYIAQALGEGAQARVEITQQAPLAPTTATAPAPPPHFTGRRVHLDILKAILDADQTRLLTALQGMAGVGKTATALKLAQEVADAYPGGVFWADLPRHAGDPRPVLRGWARCCAHDLAAEPDLNVLADQVRGLLAARRDERGPLLALVDDVRQRWLAAAQLLQRALPPGVPLLLTTRDERLADALGARVHCLDALPPGEALDLLARLAGVQVVQAEPEACKRLLEAVGHLPLAIELAGKRLAGLARKPGVKGIVAGLARAVAEQAAETLRLPGHPGLAATFAISYEALPEETQRLFRGLGVFEPGPLRAAHVGDVLELSRVEAEAALDALVPPALLAWGEAEGSYTLHPLLRQYAQALLAEAGEEEAARERHLSHFLAYAEAHAQPTAADYDALEAVQADVLAAMERVYLGEQWEAVRCFAWALCRPARGYLGVRGYWTELRTRLEQAIHAAEAEGYQRDAAAFAGNLATLLMNTGDLETARREYRRVLSIFEELDERGSVAIAYHQLGRLAQARGEYEQAQRLYHHSLNIKKELGDRVGVANTLHQLGMLARVSGNYEEARRLYRQSLEIREELGDRGGIARSLHQLGNVAYFAGDYEGARRLYRQSLDIRKELRDKAGIARSLHQLAMLAQAIGDRATSHEECVQDYDQARQLYHQSLEIKKELQDRAGMANTMHQLGVLAQAVGNRTVSHKERARNYERARSWYRQSLKIEEALGNRAGIARSLGQLANLAKATGDYERARQQYEAALAVFQELDDKKNEASVLGQLANLGKVEGDQT